MKQLPIFMNPSRLSWKIISRSSDQIFNASSPYFHGLWYFYLPLLHDYSLPPTHADAY